MFTEGTLSPLPTACPRPSTLVPFDLNGPGKYGTPIYACLSNADLSAGGAFIADMTVVASEVESDLACPDGFTQLPGDLNVGSIGSLVAICVKYSGPYGKLLQDISVVYGNVPCTGAYTKVPVDINSGIDDAVPAFICKLVSGE